MFSSGQWSFNPAMYQNIPYEQVDWASLAQQWIKMKETVPPVNQGLPVPPVSQISKPLTSVPPVLKPTVTQNEPSNDIEGGEAPMDMDTKDDETFGPVGVAQGGNWNQWNNWPNQWSWGWSGSSGTVPLDDTASSTSSTIDSKAYWNDDSFSPTPNKLSADSWTKGHKMHERNHPKPTPEQFQVMDAAKKKQLPAWIREGLNKMEREKQKKLERERMMQEKLLRDQMKGEQEKETPSERTTVFTPFSTASPKEEESRRSPFLPSASRYQQKNYMPPTVDPPIRQRSLSRSSKEDVSGLRKTKDQIMEESMLKVRRILTEILLETTENQVQLIAKEEYRRAKSSASAQQIRKSNALSSLTGNLGLDIYESESESSGSESQRDDRRADSDEELKMIIDRKKRDFQRIEDEIELEIEDQEAKERLVVQQELNNEEENDDNDDAEDAGKYSREKANHESNRRLQEPSKENREDRGFSSNHGKSGEVEIHHHENRATTKQKLNSQTDTINGDRRKKAKDGNVKTKIKTSSSSSASSSSLSSSSSSSSSTSSSSESSSGSSNSSNSGSERSTSGSRLSKKKRKLDAKRREKEKFSRSKRYRSRSRSSSRSRYSHSDRKHNTKSRKSESVDKRKSSPHRQRSRSPSYRKRSPSYRRGSRETSKSKYKESSRNYELNSKRKRRSSSTDSKHSHHRRR